jgi:dihydrofolate synthase/folylpolyglutamate synthase
MNQFNTYEEGVAFLFQQLPMYSQIGAKALKPKLDNIIALCNAMDNIHNRLKLIHVAGSNGKGSTSHIIAATLQEAGFSVGLHTSPHLVDIRERFRIDGGLVSKEWVLEFLNKYYNAIVQIQPSYFELNVALAFYVFNKANVDYAVIETGLGGTWDSTNVITPILSVITNISLEHTAILGDTLAKIAGEKAGIIKPKVPVVIGETHQDTEQVFFLKAHQQQSPIVFADARWDIIKTSEDEAYQYFKLVDKGAFEIYPIKTDLKGAYQSKNIVTSIAAVQQLMNVIPNLSLNDCFNALAKIKSSTGLQGRWDKVASDPTIILDVAHNPGGMEYLNNNLATFEKENRRLHFVLGFASDKDVNKVLSFFPKDGKYYFTQASVPRAMSVSELTAKAINVLEGESFDTVDKAIDAALMQIHKDDVLIITGSFFIVADAINYLKSINMIL